MANPAGSFIWYELMTPDPAGSKRFYDAVVAGWTIEAQPSGDMDYRMITRSDGGNSGGVLRLTEEMQGHGARPCWLGYLGVPDVDAAVARVEEDGGRTLMPGHDIRGVGRIAMVTDPDGAPFYLMTPTAPAGRPDAERATSSPSIVRSTSAGTSCRQATRIGRSPSTPGTSAGGRRATWIWASSAPTASSTRARP